MTYVLRHVITAPKAAELAGISYRQLDHWAKRGWVRPSIDTGVGRAGRRLYNPEDVLRLAALGHFGRSGLDVGRLGPLLGELDLPADTDFLIVVDPDGEVESVDANGLRDRVSRPAVHAVFDPAPLAGSLEVDGQPVAGTVTPLRVERSA